RVEFGRFVAHEEAGGQEKELRLPLVQVAHEVHEQPEIALLAADDGDGRMLARRGQINAGGRTLNLDEPLGAAADGANLPAERRTGAPRLALAAKRTSHGSDIVLRSGERPAAQTVIAPSPSVCPLVRAAALVYNRAKIRPQFIGTRLAPAFCKIGMRNRETVQRSREPKHD